MTKGNFYIFFIILILLSSCVSHPRVKKHRKAKKIALVKTTHYVTEGYRNFPDSITQRKTFISISNTDYLSFRQGDISISKELGYYDPDSTVSSLSFMALSDTTNNYFDINWERNGLQEGKDLFYFEHHSYDYATNSEYSVSYSNFAKQANFKETVVLETFGDEISYTRTYKIPDEILSYYKDIAEKHKDSLGFLGIPDIPDLSSCTELLSSVYRTTEYLTEDSTLSRTTTVDSNLVNGTIQVKQKIRESYQSRTMDSTGMTIEVLKYPQGDNPIYWELHYKDRAKPVYQFNYQLNASKTDTIIKMEMTSKIYNDSSYYHFTVNETPKSVQKISPDITDYRIPITKRVVNVWRDKKWIPQKVHVHAYTERGSHLEYLYTYNKKGKLITEVDKRTIPEISGNAIYDVFGPYYYNYNIFRKVPTGFKRKYYRTFLFDIFKKKQSTEFFGKRTKRLEKDRKNKYEKRVYTNSYEKKVFEIYYK